jgi:hypothetical protein
MQQLKRTLHAKRIIPKSIGIEFSTPSLTMINFRLEKPF